MTDLASLLVTDKLALMPSEDGEIKFLSCVFSFHSVIITLCFIIFHRRIEATTAALRWLDDILEALELPTGFRIMHFWPP